MKKLLLIVALFSFLATSVVSASTLATDTTIEFCEDDKKCDKKNCKHKKKACTKTDKATAKKCCAGKAGAKTCSKKKKETTEKK